MKLNSGRLIVSGVLQRANALNHNGRLYPKNILEREVQLFIEKKIRDSKSSLGELNHPEGPTVHLDDVSHLITDLNFEGKHVVGKAQILPTPIGIL